MSGGPGALESNVERLGFAGDWMLTGAGCSGACLQDGLSSIETKGCGGTHGVVVGACGLQNTPSGSLDIRGGVLGEPALTVGEPGISSICEAGAEGGAVTELPVG